MSIKNHPGTPTEESTEAKRSVDTHSTTPLVNDATVPAVNQLISEEVSIFLNKVEQSLCSPADVETLLLDRINKRLSSENTKHGLKGALAYRPLQVLPPSEIATCILRRELLHTGLIGESEETAELMTYQTTGPDKGLYVPAERDIRRLARQYNRTISSGALNDVVNSVRDSVDLLDENKDGDVVALANGLFDLRTKELRPFSPDVVLTSKASVALREDATTCPVIDGWNVDEWIREFANDDLEVERLFWQIIAALFRPEHPFNKGCSCTPLPDQMVRALLLICCATSSGLNEWLLFRSLTLESSSFLRHCSRHLLFFRMRTRLAISCGKRELSRHG